MRDIVILDLNLYNFLCIYRSVEEKEAETQEARKKKKEKLDKLIEDGYFELDKDSQRVKWTFSRPVDRYVQFIRFPSPSLLQIFIEFVPRSLLEKIIPEFPPGDLLISKKRGYIFEPRVYHLYMSLALCIRIQGLQNKPQQNQQNGRPLRDAINSCRDHFKTLVFNSKLPGIDILTKLNSLPLFTNHNYEDICFNFKKVLKQNMG